MLTIACFIGNSVEYSVGCWLFCKVSAILLAVFKEITSYFVIFSEIEVTTNIDDNV